MRNLHHLAARLYNAPLMLLPAVADTFGTVFESVLSGAAPASSVIVMGQEAPDERALQKAEGYAGNVKQGSRFADKPYILSDAGVAVLPIYGALAQRAGQIGADCMPLASYERTRRKYDAMMADSDVRAILIEWDSPGGEVAGNFDLAGYLVRSRGSKPVWSHANEGAFSAAYSLAAATDRIAVTQSGQLGSIGVVMLHLDQSERDAKQGLKFTPIFAGARKVDFNSHMPLTREALAVAQAEVDRLYDMFVTHVATARAMDAKAVRATEAGVFAANDAKALGLADAVASFDETLAELTELVSKPASTTFTTAGRLAAQHNPQGETRMSQENQAATGTPPASPTQASIDAARAEGVAQGRAEGVQAERKRISGILTHEAAKSRGKLAHTLAFDTDMSVEAATKVLEAAGPEAEASKPSTSPLAQAMAQVPNPAVGPDAAKAGAGGDDTPQGLAKNVVALFNTAKGAKA